jgi:hypothetical protein
VVAQFKQETGIQVEVTLSNNEEIISKLRATGGAGFDLAQPSQDRITGVQREFGIYKPIDLSQVKVDQFTPEILEITRKNTTLDGKLYGLPYLWGADGLVVNTKYAKVSRLSGPVPAGPEGQDLAAAAPAGADGVCVRRRQGSICAVWRSQGVRGADGERRRDAVGLQGERAVLLRQQGPAAQRHALGRDRRGDDVGYRRLDAQSPGSEYPVHRAQVRRHGLAGHLRAAGARPQRRRRLRLDQFHHAAGRGGQDHQFGRQLDRRPRH